MASFSTNNSSMNSESGTTEDMYNDPALSTTPSSLLVVPPSLEEGGHPHGRKRDEDNDTLTTATGPASQTESSGGATPPPPPATSTILRPPSSIPAGPTRTAIPVGGTLDIHKKDDSFASSSVVSSEGDSGGGDPSSFSSPFAVSISQKKQQSQHYNAPTIQRRSVVLDDSITLHQLKFQALGLHGREHEIEILQQALQDCMGSTRNGGSTSCPKTTKKSKQLVLIGGTAGTGKSRLAATVLSLVKKATTKTNTPNRHLCAKGKFHSHLVQNPYAGMAVACGEICGHIVNLPPPLPSAHTATTTSVQQALAQALEETVGHNELRILTNFIPVLQEILDLRPATSLEQGNSSMLIPERMVVLGSTEEIRHRCVFAFQRFFRVVASFFQPLVLILDDLQWADAGSMELLQVILQDTENPHPVFVVGSYRSNEVVEETHILTRVRSEWCTPSSQEFHLIDIQLNNVSVDSACRMIQDLLQSNEDSESQRTRQLAVLCHRRTNGNPFFVLQFLKLLHEEKFLKYNFGTLQWVWDTEHIEKSTMATENVVDLLKSKMNELSKAHRDVLQLAALLNDAFQEKLLFLIWEDFVATPEANATATRKDLQTILSNLQGRGYLEVVANSSDNGKEVTYSFTHDAIQEAALSLVPWSHQRALGQRVGTTMVNKLSPIELESAIFIVVQLLNETEPPSEENERLILADLNRKASRQATKVSAYETAAVCTAKGIDLLGPTAWTDHYELALELYTIGTQCESFLGNNNLSEKYYKEVVAQKSHSMDDKLPVYTTRFVNLSNQGKTDEAIEEALILLKKFGCRFPRSKLRILFDVLGQLSGIQRQIRQGVLDKVRSEPPDDNPTRMKLCVILDNLSTHLYTMKHDLMPLAVFRPLLWTFQYGLNSQSAVSLSKVSLVISGVLGDFKGGSDVARKALEIRDSVTWFTEASTLFVVHAFTLLWTEPIRDQMKALLPGYEVGFRVGDVQNASWIIYHYCLCRLITSFSLELALADCLTYLSQMKNLKRAPQQRLFALQTQTIKTFVDRKSIYSAPIYGDVHSEEEAHAWKDDTLYTDVAHHLYRPFGYLYFGEFVKCADLALQTHPDAFMKAYPCNLSLFVETFAKGVSCLAAARLTRNRRYLRVGKHLHQRVKSWVKKGCPNAVHYEALLDAEWAAYRGQSEMARKRYEAAIALSARGGLLLDAGLSCERYADFLLETKTGLRDVDDVVYQLRKSIRYYGDVGAHRKTVQLEEKFAHLLATPETPHGVPEHVPVSSIFCP